MAPTKGANIERNPPNISPRLLFDPRYLLALGFGSGLLPKAPGTFGTLAAVPIYLYFFADASSLEYLLALLLAFCMGVLVCDWVSKDLQSHDHSSIVWDEFVGLWVTLWGLPTEPFWIIAGVISFRVMDIIKPWPVGWIDSRVSGGIGIMSDDLIAGLMGCATLNILALALGIAH